MLDIAEGKKVVMRGLLILAVVTIAEVVFALFANGHIVHGTTLPRWFVNPVMIVASLYKAYFITFYFMHLKYEVKGMMLSVLLPVLLLVWGIIAFLQEGGSWGARRELIKEFDAEKAGSVSKPTGQLQQPDTYQVR